MPVMSAAIAEAIDDAAELEALAVASGITKVEARRFLARLYELRMPQYLRMMQAAAESDDRMRRQGWAKRRIR